MLIHVRPRCYGPLARHSAELLEFSVPDLGIYLTAKGDLVTRHPYPNRCYSVGCRRDGNRADDGLLIEAGGRVDRFTSVALWWITVGEKHWAATHETHYVVLDSDHDAISDDMVTWHPFAAWPDRWPPTVEGPPSEAAPRFDVFDRGISRGDIIDRLFDKSNVAVVQGAIQHRRTTFYLPTIERDRLEAKRKFFRNDRLPPARMAIAA